MEIRSADCCVWFLQTVIKELNLKFKIKENPRVIKRERRLSYSIAFKITLKNTETGQLKGVLAHLRQRR
jgi:hypothetical protein